MFTNNNVGLPFSPTQLMFNVGPYGIPNPVLNPYSNGVGQLYEHLAKAVIETIINKANTTSLQVFLFNQHASQNFMGNETVALLSIAMDYLAFLNNTRNMNIQSAIGEVSENMVKFAAAMNVLDFQELTNYCDTNAVRQVIGYFNELQNTIENDKRNRGGGFNSAAIRSQFSGNGNGGSFERFNNNGSSIGGNRFSNAGLSGNSRIFQNANEKGPAETNGNFAMRDFGQSKQGQEAPQEVNQVQKKKWVPTDHQRYRPAYQPSIQSLVEKYISKTGNFIYDVQEGEIEMDAQRHRITGLFGTIPVAMAARANLRKANEKLASAVSDGKTAPVDNTNVTIDAYSRYVGDSSFMPLEVGFENLWSSGVIEHMIRTQAREKERAESQEPMTPINILQWGTGVLTPIIATREEAGLIRQMTALSVEELVELLTNTKAFSNAILATLDGRLTETVNRAIANNLSIPSLTIDSFAEDWYALVNEITTSYGELVAGSLISREKEIIEASLTVLNAGDTERFISECYREFKNDGDTQVLYFVENVSCTMLNFWSAELDIDFIKGTSAQLTKMNTRIFYDLADLIFKNYGNFAYRNFIRTADGKTLEVTKGWIGTEASYLIALVD